MSEPLKKGWPWYGPAVLAGSFVILLGVLLYHMRMETFAERRAHLERDIDNAVGDLTFRLKGHQDYLLMVAEDLSESKLDVEGARRRARKYLEDNQDIQAIVGFDANARPIWLAKRPDDPFSMRTASLPDPRWAASEAMTEGDDRAVGFFTSLGGDSALAQFVPMRRGGKVLGALGAFYSAKNLLTHALKPNVVEKYEISFQADDKTVLGPRGNLRRDQDLSLSRPFEYAGFKGTLRFTGYETLVDWRIVVLSVLCLGLALGVAWAMWALGLDNVRRQRIEVELQRAKEAAEAANRAKSELLANISHEIRTPLGAIKGFVDLLSEEDGAPAERLRSLEAIRRNADNLIDLIGDILDLSKIEAGLLEMEPKRFAIPDVVGEVIALFRPEAQRRNLTLDVIYDGPIPATIHTDPRRLRQVLTNVIGNAVKFTESGSVKVVIQLVPLPGESSAPRLRFTVEDTGIGIAAENQGRLFQPFSQEDGSISRRFGGTGLGLVVSRRLARALGGDLTLVRTEKGVGSVFAFEIDPGDLTGIPLLVGLVQANRVEKRSSASRDMDLEGVRILIVEDCGDNQIIYRSYLEFSGAKVTLASNGAAGVQAAVADDFDLILMDVQMPEMDGYEATRSLRQRGVRTPIIALTAHAMKGERERCLAAGCDDYLTKPIEAEDLLRTIARYVRSGATPLKSLYASDPRVAGVLPGFVGGLAGRISDMRDALRGGDLPRLTGLAHKLRGTAGNYGFPALASVAGRLEDGLRRDGDGFAAEPLLRELEVMAQKVEAGLGQERELG